MSSRIRSILIANRGEIASRIIRACKRMGIRSVAVFSDADRHLPYVTEADTAVHIGANNPTESYLDANKIIKFAKQLGVDAIHPGYGFLSENVLFAQQCQAEGLVFIGPHPEAIQLMGSKSEAKTLMLAHQVPVIPGYQGTDQSVDRLVTEAKNVGFPLLLKATAGGGGKGMRVVRQAEELKGAIDSAKREALKAFANDELIIEKFIENGRHIEVQIFGDKDGNVIHLMERECTIQRRYQKLIEESPSPVLTAEKRDEFTAAALAAAKALKYDNAGTVEFIFDEKTQDFYFLEVNTRLQVEHPVTEEILGLDLVKMQIESAQGSPLSVQQADVKATGYAIECRLYAEDPENDYLPVSGKIHHFALPQVDGFRLESGVQSGAEISIFYDPMIAKLIVWGEDRMTALQKMQYVLRNMLCVGIKTNQNLLQALLNHPDFIAGRYTTNFLQKQKELLQSKDTNGEALQKAAMAATIFLWKQRDDNRTLLRSIPSGWRNSFYAPQKDVYLAGERELTVLYRFTENKFYFDINDETIVAQFQGHSDNTIQVEIDGVINSFFVLQTKTGLFIHSESIGLVSLTKKGRFPITVSEKIEGGYEAPMPSQVVKVLVNTGQEVEQGQDLLILSSMKMENTIVAKESGLVEEVYISEGGHVDAGTLLLKINSAN